MQKALDYLRRWQPGDGTFSRVLVAAISVLVGAAAGTYLGFHTGEQQDAARAASPVATHGPLPGVWRDERPLVPGSERPTEAVAPSPGMPAAAPRIIAEPQATLPVDVAVPLPIRIEPRDAVSSGAYLIVRGLPAEASLSVGLGAGPGQWVVGANELERLQLRLPASAAGRLTLALDLLSGDGQILVRERLTFEVAPPPAPAGPEAAPVPGNAVQTDEQPAPPGAPPLQPEPAAPIVTDPVAAAPAPASPGTEAGSSAPAPDERSKALLARGKKLLDAGNIAFARPLLERAAASGEAEAALLLGRSFDARWLKEKGAIGVAADDARSHNWYALARELGAGAAADQRAVQPKQRIDAFTPARSTSPGTPRRLRNRRRGDGRGRRRRPA